MLITEKTIWTSDNSDLLRYREMAKCGDVVIGQDLQIELDNLAEDIETRRFGYDVTPYLPAIYDEGGNWEDGNWGATGNYMGEPVPEFTFDKNSSQVLNDWRELLTELYETNHVQPIAEWAA